jgi:GNAT superfamily N-acetyltransferase
MLIREARVSDAAGIARVHIDTWRTTYQGTVPQDRLDRMNYEKREHSWADALREGKNYTAVAENQQAKVVGFAVAGENRSAEYDYDGELHAIYVLKSYQRQGIGRKLFESAIEHLQDRGCCSMILWALEDNAYGAFYEKLGGRLVGKKLMEIGGKELQAMA